MSSCESACSPLEQKITIMNKLPLVLYSHIEQCLDFINLILHYNGSLLQGCSCHFKSKGTCLWVSPTFTPQQHSIHNSIKLLNPMWVLTCEYPEVPIIYLSPLVLPLVLPLLASSTPDSINKAGNWYRIIILLLLLCKWS